VTTSDGGCVASDMDSALIARADRALRTALREGIVGHDVEELLDWVTVRRARQRQARARRQVAEVLAEIRQAEGDDT